MVEVGENVVPAVHLQDVTLAMDVPHGTWTTYLHRYTCELETISQGDLELPDWGDDDPEFRQYQRQEVARLRAIVKSKDFLELPSQFEIGEFSIMKRYCSTLEDEPLREALREALRARNAFRRFKEVAREGGVLVAWLTFRERAVEQFAADWLDANGIAYHR